MYDYEQDGIDEVINRSPSGPAPDPALYETLYDALFDPDSGAVANELRQPLPDYLQAVQTRDQQLRGLPGDQSIGSIDAAVMWL